MQGNTHARTQAKYRLIFAIVRWQPGIGPAALDSWLDFKLSQSHIDGMEMAGFLLAEDDRAGLYAFRDVSE